MAGELPDYQDRVTVSGGPSVMISATPLMSVPGVASITPATALAQAQGEQARAMGGLGNEIASISLKINEGIQQTKATEAMSGFLDDNDRLTQQYLKDKDYATAEDRFRKDLEASKLSRLEGISDPQLRARTELQMRRSSIEAAGTVRNNVVSNMRDITLSSLDTSETNAQRRYLSAGSDVARVAIVDEYAADVNRAVDAGFIDRQTAVKRGMRFQSQLQNSQVMELVQKNPAAAVARLEDPSQFLALDPVTRQSYIAQANERRDAAQNTAIVAWAPFNQVGAALTINRVISPEQADVIFDKGIRRLENATGQVDAVSPAGALGLAQIMPGTARDVARSIGRSDIAGLSDAELEQRLKTDGALNLQLGRTYFRQMATRYDGNIVLAAAAYNAGPGNGDRWRAEAESRFGVNYTPAQLASVIDFKESRNYVINLYKNAGIPMDVAFSSPAALVRTANGVGAAIAQQQSQEAQLYKTAASAVASTNPIEQRYQMGFNVDPGEAATYRATQQASADRGDAAAAERLRTLDQAQQMSPYIQQAYRTAPVMLDGVISRMESDMAGSPNVSQAQVIQLKAFKAVRDEVVRRRDADPISLGERGGFYGAVEIDPAADPDSPTFRASMSERGVQAVTAARIYQGSSAALKPEEAAAFKQRYETGNADEKFRIVKSFADTLPEQAYRDTLKQVAGSDGGTQFVGQIARTRPELAREIFKGQALAQTEGVKNKMGDVRNALSDKLGGQIYVSPDQQGSVIDAALALYTARRGASGNLYEATDSAAIEKAIEDVAGPIVKRNGVRTPAPPGMTAGQFTAALDGITDTSFDQFGGAYDRNGKPYSGSFLSSRAVLKQLEPGGSKYVVVLPQGAGGKEVPVWQAPDPQMPNRPLVIDMSVLKNTQPGQLSAYQRGRAAYRGEINDRIQQTRVDTEGVAP